MGFAEKRTSQGLYKLKNGGAKGVLIGGEYKAPIYKVGQIHQNLRMVLF